MNTEQLYLEGFVKRAAEYGLTEHQAIDLLKHAGSYRESKVAPEHNIGLLRRGGTIWEEQEKARIDKELAAKAYQKMRSAIDAPREFAAPGYFGTESSNIDPEDLKRYAAAAGQKEEVQPMKKQYSAAKGARDVVKPTGYWKGNTDVTRDLQDFAPRSQFAAPKSGVVAKLKAMLSKFKK